MLRALAGKKQAPTAAIIDSQSVKADATVGAATRGYDAGKKINGRKRHIAVDTLGFSHLIRARRLARDYEPRIDSAEAMAWWAASIPATRRLARSGRPTPRRLNRSAA
nr:transposase [Streptomyces rhizoryzae]